MDSEFQSLVGFGIPFGVFRNQKPNIPDNTSTIIPDSEFAKQNFPDSGIRIPYMGRREFLQSNPLVTSRLLFNRTDEPMEMIRNFQGA